jgi:hypothetical protein
MCVVQQLAIDFETARFNGADYVASRDNPRLAGQMLRIFNLCKDGQWRTLEQIANATGDPENSVSAQLRHFRKARFGGHTVNRQHQGNGLYLYQLIVNGT